MVGFLFVPEPVGEKKTSDLTIVLESQSQTPVRIFHPPGKPCRGIYGVDHHAPQGQLNPQNMRRCFVHLYLAGVLGAEIEKDRKVLSKVHLEMVPVGLGKRMLIGIGAVRLRRVGEKPGLVAVEEDVKSSHDFFSQPVGADDLADDVRPSRRPGLSESERSQVLEASDPPMARVHRATMSCADGS